MEIVGKSARDRVRLAASAVRVLSVFWILVSVWDAIVGEAPPLVKYIVLAINLAPNVALFILTEKIVWRRRWAVTASIVLAGFMGLIAGVQVLVLLMVGLASAAPVPAVMLLISMVAIVYLAGCYSSFGELAREDQAREARIREASAPPGRPEDPSQWYCIIYKRLTGPMAVEELQAWLSTNRLQGFDLVWDPSAGCWMAAGECAALLGAGAEG